MFLDEDFELFLTILPKSDSNLRLQLRLCCDNSLRATADRFCKLETLSIHLKGGACSTVAAVVTVHCAHLPRFQHLSAVSSHLSGPQPCGPHIRLCLFDVCHSL